MQTYVRGPYKRKKKCKRGHVVAGDNLRMSTDRYGRPRTGCIACQQYHHQRYKSDPVKRARQAANMRRWTAANLDRVVLKERRRNMRQYGITLEQYDEMLVAQNGVCAICREECKSGRRLSVDHCHETGKVRGLLCGNCNQGIGRFGHSPERLSAALAFLNRTVA